MIEILIIPANSTEDSQNLTADVAHLGLLYFHELPYVPDLFEDHLIFSHFSFPKTTKQKFPQTSNRQSSTYKFVSSPKGIGIHFKSLKIRIENNF